MLGLQPSMCLNLKWSLSETLQNTLKAPGLLKSVGFDVTNLSVPPGDGFEENSSVALKEVYVI